MESTIKKTLRNEFAERQTRNTSYSLRAFARDLGVGSTTLSDVLSGKRELSKRNQQKIIEKLLVSPVLKEKIQQEQTGKRAGKVDERTLLDEDTFHVISDWYCIAILNLVKLKEHQSSPSWIAKRLGIEREQAEDAVERLLRLGLLKKIHGKFARTSKPLTTTTDIPSGAIKKHHLQILRLAEQSLLNDPVDMREMGLVTMPANIKKLAKAKEILLNTRKKIADLLEDGETSEVYTLAFQLFPVTKGERHE